MFLHLVDATAEDVVADYQTIRRELKLYSDKLQAKPAVVALNKCDSLSDEEIAEKKAALEKVCAYEVFTISAAANQGLKPCLRAVDQFIGRLRQKPEENEQAPAEKPSKPWSPLD